MLAAYERARRALREAYELHSRGARVESNRTHRAKREVWRYCLTARYLHLRFTSELDTSACNMRTPSCYRTNGALIPYLVKKEKRAARTLFSFLVEVWRFELQASSTRNWRATNCATPRSIKFYDLGDAVMHFRLMLPIALHLELPKYYTTEARFCQCLLAKCFMHQRGIGREE